MPKDHTLKKILMIGSGPIVIGQAAEFDYAGTQACQSLREEGVEVVLVNSNPATIMTDIDVADKVYIEPMTPEFLTQVIRKRTSRRFITHSGGADGPQSGGGAGRVRCFGARGSASVGTDLRAISCAEDREQFRHLRQRRRTDTGQ